MKMETYDLLSRQIVYLGLKNQEKLSRAKVAVVGAGGLGSFVISMLVRAGMGSVKVVDRDVVEESNLQRMIVFDMNDVGKPKSNVIEEKLGNINPECKIHSVKESVNEKNSEKLLSGSDVVVDCTDNMDTRYAINKFCVGNKIPWVYGSAIRDEGFSSTFAPSGKPCFLCLYPRKPRPGVIKSCNVLGILSPTVGMISSWEVMEVLKLLTGFSEPNYGKLLRISLKNPEFQFLKIKTNKKCEVCGNG